MKKIFKVNQFIGEKIGIIDGTSVEHELLDLENRYQNLIEVYSKVYRLIKKFVLSTAVQKSILSDVFSMNQSSQPTSGHIFIENEISAVISKHSQTIGGELSKALECFGQNFEALSDCRSNLDQQLREGVYEKFHQMVKKNHSGIEKMIKKMNSTRLDYDSIKNKKDRDADILEAKEKYEAAKLKLKTAINEIVENNERMHTELLHVVSKAIHEYFKCSALLMQDACNRLKDSLVTLESKPRIEVSTPSFSAESYDDQNSSKSLDVGTKPGSSKFGSAKSHADSEDKERVRAAFDFTGRETDELTVKTGDIITVIKKVNDEWLLGDFSGKTGLLPVCYTVPDE